MKFKVGDKVKSKRYGKGEIIHLEKVILSEYPLSIRFEKVGVISYTEKGRFLTKSDLSSMNLKQDKIKKVKDK